MAKTLAWIFGIVFVVIGILGYVSNPIVGMDGFFMTNGIHNIIHLLSGILLIVAAIKGEGASKMCFKIVGIVYLLVTILGFIQIGNGSGMLLGLVNMNAADNYLHLVLTIIFLLAGFMGGAKMANAPAPAQMDSTV